MSDGPEFIDTVAMVAVGVGDDYCVETANFRSKQLLAQIGPAIDEDALAGAFDEDR